MLLEVVRVTRWTCVHELPPIWDPYSLHTVKTSDGLRFIPTHRQVSARAGAEMAKLSHPAHAAAAAKINVVGFAMRLLLQKEVTLTAR